MGHDNITSANDLVYQYTLDGVVVPKMSGSTLTLNNLPRGTHTVQATVIDQGGLKSTTFSDTISNVPTVGDGGFEAPVLGSGNFMYAPPTTTAQPWTFSTDNRSGIASNGSAFTSGNPPAPEGSQVALIQNTGSFSQSVNFQATGSYTINFLAAQRANFGTSIETFVIMVDNQVVGTFTPGSTNYQAKAATFAVTVAGAHTITFVGTTKTGDNTAFIDNINIAVAVAPPANVTTLADGGFETPSIGNGNFVYGPATSSNGLGASPWTFGANSGISGNNSGFTSGNPPAPEGSQVAFLQIAGSFSQLVNFSKDGSYTINFLAAQRGNFAQTGETFNILVDNQVVGTFTPGSTSYQALTATFTVSMGNHNITFKGTTTTGDHTAFIDNITIALATNAPVVPDGGFETHLVGPNNFQYDPNSKGGTPSPWTFSSTNAGISGNNSGFTSGNPPAPEGTQVAFLQIAGSFSQSVTFTDAGSYTINFLAAQRGNFAQTGETFNILVDNQVVGSFKPGSTSYQAQSTLSFMVTAGSSHKITFVGTTTGDNTAFIDNITIATA